MKTLEELQHSISNELERLYPQLKQSPKELYDPIVYILQLGGKRMRPALALMANDLFGGNIEDVVKPALGIEVFHNFTLLHDDIMDKAPLRRNKPTVHEKWSTDIAILSGDAMFVKSFELVMQCPDDVLRDVLNTFNTTAVEVCEGQQLDMNFERDEKITIPDYIRMITLKTAVLLAGSLKIGALTANANPEDAKHIYEFGKNIGIAFQLQDDILDVYADPKKFGKQVGGDIISNKKTFLLLKALAVANSYTREELNNWLFAKNTHPKEKVEAVTHIYNTLNIKQLAQEEMKKYYSLGLSHLEKISVAPEKKKVLLNFSESLMERDI